MSVWMSTLFGLPFWRASLELVPSPISRKMKSGQLVLAAKSAALIWINTRVLMCANPGAWTTLPFTVLAPPRRPRATAVLISQLVILIAAALLLEAALVASTQLKLVCTNFWIAARAKSVHLLFHDSWSTRALVRSAFDTTYVASTLPRQRRAPLARIQSAPRTTPFNATMSMSCSPAARKVELVRCAWRRSAP